MCDIGCMTRSTCVNQKISQGSFAACLFFDGIIQQKGLTRFLFESRVTTVGIVLQMVAGKSYLVRLSVWIHYQPAKDF